MSFAKVTSAQVTLLEARLVEVEVDISRGLHAFSIVGLPDKAVEEARDRISAAIKNSGLTSPKQKNQKVVISLAPAELKKEGSGFDVAMAIAYLKAAGDLSFRSESKLFIGELSLTGEIRSVRGALPIAREAARLGIEELYVPKGNAVEAALIKNIRVYPVGTLRELIDHLAAKTPEAAIAPQPQTALRRKRAPESIDFADIRGQAAAKRGLEIAAAGGHNIALFGPPGTGKTLLSRAFTRLLPPLTFEEVLEVTSIHSVARSLDGELITEAPFRSPHHTASHVAIVGGGAQPKPGEVTLAHRGVLFLDEFPEFERRVVEALREPLEEGLVSISRARGSAQFPANFILIAALNPCPCGYFGSKRSCRCTPLEFERYRKKLSGPLLDRIDMWIEVGHVDYATLSGAHKGAGETSREIGKRVLRARKVQGLRFKKDKNGDVRTNSDMGVRDLDRHIMLSDEVRDILKRAAANLDLSPRAYHRTIKLARTIADLAESEHIEAPHVLEALQYRPKQTS